jgi:hypothetical protein
LEASQPANLVASPEAAGSCVAARPSESHFASWWTEPEKAAPKQATEPPPTDFQATAATIAQPTAMADTLPKSSPPLETQVPTLGETIIAKSQPALVETSVGQCISAKPVAHAKEQGPSPPTVVPSSTVQSDDVTVSPSESALPPAFENERLSVEALLQPPSVAAIPAKLSDYRPLAPASLTAQARPPRPPNHRPSPNTNTDLRLRLQLVPGRGGGVKALALVPDRREGMPDQLEITGTQGELRLSELRDDCYAPVPLVNACHVLSQSVEWRGPGDARRWRWVLGGRELSVLAPGEEFGLSGFVSTARLWLNFPHAVLAAERLRDGVLTALAEVGCATPEVSDDATPGVPSGWLLFRDVMPTSAVPMRDEAHILNALCPLSDIEPHFVGGIRLKRRTWLAGFSPRIRFTGVLSDDFRVMIDSQPAHTASDGAFEAPGWDDAGEHRLWFGGRTEMYTLRTMDENWECWHAHDFGRGAAICGAGTHHVDGALWHQVRVPMANPLLLGARPGEVFHCHARNDVRCETVLTLIPFAPVWALPLDPAHADKRSARILSFRPAEPVGDIQIPTGNRTASRALLAWISAIREAGCKGLVLAADSEESRALWRRYRNAAKQLRRKMR